MCEGSGVLTFTCRTGGGGIKSCSSGGKDGEAGVGGGD